MNILTLGIKSFSPVISNFSLQMLKTLSSRSRAYSTVVTHDLDTSLTSSETFMRLVKQIEQIQKKVDELAQKSASTAQELKVESTVPKVTNINASQLDTKKVADMTKILTFAGTAMTAVVTGFVWINSELKDKPSKADLKAEIATVKTES